MFGHIAESALNVSRLLWEPVGVCALLGMLYFIYETFPRKHWRNVWFYMVVAAILFAWAWRVYMHANGRYHSILILPAMLLVFHFFRNAFNRCRLLTYILLTTLFIACIGRNLRGNPWEYELLELYDDVKKDAVQYENPIGLNFLSPKAQVGFYTDMEVLAGNYGDEDLNEVFRGLRGNLNMFYQLNDCIYIFVAVPKDFPGRGEAFVRLIPENVEIFGRGFMDRKKRKELFALKYIPQKEEFNSRDLPFLCNGDFKNLLSGELREKKLDYFGRRAKRFLSEKPSLPEKWEFYHSLTAKSFSLAGVETRNNENVLRLQADGSYMCALTPFFDIKTKRELYFTLHANKESFIEFKRSYRNPGSVFPTILTLKLPAGFKREFKLSLPAGNGMKDGNVCFWLSSGDVEISNVKIK